MPEFLVFRLYGPLAAWGDIAVGEQRPTTPHPSKSAALGLIAAAVGIRRHEDEKHRALADGYGYAVRVEASGVLLRDYHTTQIPDSTKRLKHLRTRRDETSDPQNLYTILSTRDYRCDGLYTVCLRPRGEGTLAPETLASALRCPRLPLYLGRKSCPLALPLLPKVVEAPTFEAALDQYDADHGDEQRTFLEERLKKRLDTGATGYFWDETTPTELSPLHTTPRQDHPLSRRRWQFGKRNEHYGRRQP